MISVHVHVVDVFDSALTIWSVSVKASINSQAKSELLKQTQIYNLDQKILQL